jgi:serine/threonine protein kinase
MSSFEYLGPYRILETIGRGGMGRIFRAQHAKSGEIVAVKLIADNVADDPNFRRRFDDEIVALTRLKHPNIVWVIGCGEEQGHLFYSMELVEGETLQERLRRERKLDWQTTVDLAIDICSALKFAHNFGVIHRDLKPSNLIFNSQGKVKIVDFGIAKLFGNTEQTVAGSVLGTADYMAPEQASGSEVTELTDLYALGNVLYACFAGHPPFKNRSLTGLIDSVRNETPLRIEELNPEVPLEIAELIHDLLAKAPRDRPRTALAVMNRLMAIREGLRRTPQATHETPSTGPTLSPLSGDDVDPRGEDDEELRFVDERPGDLLPIKGEKSGKEGRLRAALGDAARAELPEDELIPTRLADQDDKTLGPIGADEEMPYDPSLSDRVTIEMADLKPSNPKPFAAQPPSQAPLAGEGNVKGSPAKVERSFPRLHSQQDELKFAGDREDAKVIAAEERERPKKAGSVDSEGSRRSHFRMIEEHERARGRLETSAHPSATPKWVWQALSIVGMLTVLGLGVVAFLKATRRQPSDQMYAEILAAQESGNTKRAVATADQFLRLYPDDLRREAVESIRDGDGIQRILKNLRASVGLAGGTHRLAADEVAFLRSMETREYDVATARDRIQRWLDLYAPQGAATQGSATQGAALRADPTAARRSQLVTAARNELARLAQLPAEKTDPRCDELLQRIAWAEKNLDPGARVKLLEGLVSLFEGETWAKPAVDEAKRMLGPGNG